MQRNILEYLEHTVCRVPDKVAFSAEDGELTFREVFEQARSIGTQIIRDGNDRQPVAVFMKKQPKTIAAFLGVVYAGSFYVPLDAEMPRYRIEQILRNLNPAACICDDTTFFAAGELNNLGRIYRYDQIAAGEADPGALQSIRDRQIDTTVVCGSSQLIRCIFFGLYLPKGFAGWEQKVKSHAQQNKGSNTASGYGLESYLTDIFPCDFSPCA